MRSGIAIVGFVTRDAVSKGSPASFPSALAEQHVKELSRLFGREEVLGVVEFCSGNWDCLNHVVRLSARGMDETDDLIQQQMPAVLRAV